MLKAALQLTIHSIGFGVGYMLGTTVDSAGLVVFGGALMAFCAANLASLVMESRG